MYWLQFAFEFFDFWMLQRQVKASKFSFWKIQFFISRCFYKPQIDSQPQKINLIDFQGVSKCIDGYEGFLTNVSAFLLKQTNMESSFRPLFNYQ